MQSALERLLFPAASPHALATPLAPDWAQVHHELKRKGVTLWLLWQEYKAAVPEGFQYSWFCQAYRAWAGKLDVVMRQSHRAGEKLFVDYAGQTLPIVNGQSGEVHEAPDLHCGARGLQLHLCRGHLDPKPPRLDRLAMCAPLRRLVGSPRSSSPTISKPP